jgi:hypothetical protein
MDNYHNACYVTFMKRNLFIGIIFAFAILLGMTWLSSWGKNLDNYQSDVQIRETNGSQAESIHTTFQMIGGGYFFYGDDNGEHVKYQGRILEKADAASFEYLGEGYAKDSNIVFYKGLELEDADVKTLERISSWRSVFIDKNYIYFYGDVLPIGEKRQIIYFLDDGVGGIDMGNNYIKYKDRIFFWDDGGGQAVSSMVFIDANPDRFVSVDNKYCKWGKKDSPYDPCQRYGKDDEKVFYDSYEIKGADPDTFQILNGLFTKDGYAVFYDTQKLEGINPETFQVLGSGMYGKNENSVVYTDRDVVGADPKTFEILHEKYCRGYRNVLAKDKDNYYSLQEQITADQFHERLASENDEIKSIVDTCN